MISRDKHLLVAVVAVLCMVPLALLTYFTVHLSERAVLREVKARVRTTSAVTAVLLQQQMQALAELTESYASRPILIKAFADGNPANFVDDAINVQLSQVVAARPGIGGAFATDANCRLTQVRPATPSIVGVDFSFRDWCKGMKASGRTYVSSAYESAISGHPLVVAAAVAIRSAGGEAGGRPLGILGVVYTLDAIKGFAAQVARAQGVHLTITDQRATVLVGNTKKVGPPGLASAARDSRVSKALAGRSGVTRSTTAKGDTLSAFAPVAGLGWTVTAEVPAREALVGVERLRSAVLSVAGVLALVLSAGIVLLARTLRLRREAELKLKEKEASTRAILEAATDAFIAMDSAGIITAWNGQAGEIFGWPEPDALGRSLSQTIIPPDLRGRHEEGLAHFLVTGEGPVLNQRIEITALHRDGHEFPVELAIWPVRSGESWTFNAFVHDITVRKEVAADLAVARDQALGASRLKSEFLANMSHEIRTPMNGVLGMTSLLLDTDLTPAQREFAQTVQFSGEALLAIISDILDFSKIEAGRLDLESIDFDLRSLVEGVASMLRMQAEAKGVELVCTLPSDLHAVFRGDPGRLRQILTNLVANAVKFTPSGTVVVDVTMTGVEDQAVCFKVTDTGIGIAPGDQAAVFGSFSQADAATTRRYGGTGLGLAISRRLVRLMGGEIGVESALGRGSTFWFTIPLPKAEQQSSIRTDAPLVSLHRPARPGPAGPVLLAEDNLVNQRVGKAMLENLGFRVDIVADGAEAVKAANLTPYQAILMDCQMPVQDGYEATQQIRRLEDGSHHTPIIAVTASAMKIDQERCIEAGMDDYLVKPLSLQALAEVMDRWVPNDSEPTLPVHG